MASQRTRVILKLAKMKYDHLEGNGESSDKNCEWTTLTPVDPRGDVTSAFHQADATGITSVAESTVLVSHCGPEIQQSLDSTDPFEDKVALPSPQQDVNKQSSSSSFPNSHTSESESDISSDDDIQDPTYKGETSSSSSSAGAESEEDPAVEDNADVEKRKGRKRRARPLEWKKTLTKQCRNSGKEYVSSSRSGKVVKKRTMGRSCSDKCRLKCSTKIKEEDRQKIFDEYWALGDLQRQREFLLFNIESISPKYRYIREGSHRSNNNASYFTVSEKRIRVCKTYFKSTLDITDRPIRTVLQKKSCVTGGILDSDLRGKHGKHHHIADDVKEGVRHHINSIPRIESHYCRKDSKREYIEGSRTIADLHRDYVDQCKKTNLSFANYLMYSRIFHNDFNISFFKPKKDMCEDCLMFINASDEEKQKQTEKYNRHLLEKDLSRMEKDNDKKSVSSNLIVAVYDLQAVLQCPRGDASSFYYTSKINVLNFTIFELQCNTVQCFVWDETEGNRGANEIGTCVLRYLEGLEERAKNTESKKLDVIFYSDNCCGQQKNRFIFSMYLFAVNNYPFINSITHKFLVKGHSQNEGDSAHATIEREVTKSLKSGPVYVPQQYVTLIRTAKKTGKPYLVTEMNYEMFYDLKDLTCKIGLNVLKPEDEKEPVTISSISAIRFEGKNPERILFKTSYADTEFRAIAVKKTRSSSTANIQLKAVYNNKLIIKETKKQGLLKLLSKNVIPKSYSYYYNSL